MITIVIFQSGRSRGFAFAYFPDEDEAEKVSLPCSTPLPISSLSRTVLFSCFSTLLSYCAKS